MSRLILFLGLGGELSRIAMGGVSQLARDLVRQMDAILAPIDTGQESFQERASDLS